MEEGSRRKNTSTPCYAVGPPAGELLVAGRVVDGPKLGGVCSVAAGTRTTVVRHGATTFETTTPMRQVLDAEEERKACDLPKKRSSRRPCELTWRLETMALPPFVRTPPIVPITPPHSEMSCRSAPRPLAINDPFQHSHMTLAAFLPLMNIHCPRRGFRTLPCSELPSPDHNMPTR